MNNRIAGMQASCNTWKRGQHEGKTPFVQNGWKIKEFNVPARFFQKGRNVLKIVNTCQSSDFIDHWAIVSGLELKF